MEYITGIHALNLNCSLDTPGDWHQSAIQWHTLKTKKTNETVWADYGIETNSHIPENPGTFYTANHVRACLDLIYDGNFITIQGMRDNFIAHDKYNSEIFERIITLITHDNWKNIDNFMCKEYLMKWVRFKKTKGL